VELQQENCKVSAPQTNLAELILLKFILVEVALGIIKAIRTTTLSHPFY
jgi:hypothetical protein